MNKFQKISKWLSLILYERYGQNFNIQLTNTKASISVKGMPSFIVFPKIIEAFYDSLNNSLPCAYLDVGSFGFATPIDSILPQPGMDKCTEKLIVLDMEKTIVNYDIFGLVYWMLSRQEEIGATKLDLHGRFPATESHAYQYGYLERPIVDEWLIVLAQIIEKTWPDIKLKKHRFSMKVSHDVDRPARFGFSTVKQLMRKTTGSFLKKDFVSAFHAPAIFFGTKSELHKKDPYNTFDWLMDVSEKNNLTSAFYFICGTTNVKYDADYKLSDNSIKKLMKEIHRRGHEIGLHPSYSTYQNKEALLSEAHILKNTCRDLQITQSEYGGRMHYLRWEPNTMMLWEEAEMTYDSTLSYADRPGFRCGTCFEYPAINPVTKEMLKLRIRPLIAMECSVISNGYLGLGTGKEAFDKFHELKKTCEKVEGCFTLLWHNSEFSSAQRKLYIRLVDSEGLKGCN